MLRFWDAATGELGRSFRVAEKGLPYQVWRSRLSPDGKFLAVAYQPEGRGIFSPFPVRLWDATTGKPLHDLPGHFTYVEALAFSPDGKSLASVGAALQPFAQQRLKRPAGQAFVWDVGTGKAAAHLPVGASACAFAPDGKTLALATPDGAIQLWDSAKWQVRGEFRGPRERVTVLAFRPNGQLYSGSVDSTVLAWDPQSAKQPAEKK
jgi:WD40 repeat protein